jgi:hypothetical protein
MEPGVLQILAAISDSFADMKQLEESYGTRIQAKVMSRHKKLRLSAAGKKKVDKCC